MCDPVATGKPVVSVIVCRPAIADIPSGDIPFAHALENLERARFDPFFCGSLGDMRGRGGQGVILGCCCWEKSRIGQPAVLEDPLRVVGVVGAQP